MVVDVLAVVILLLAILVVSLWDITSRRGRIGVWLLCVLTAVVFAVWLARVLR